MRNIELNMDYMFFLPFVAVVGCLLCGYDTAAISGGIRQVTVQFYLNDWQQGWYVGCATLIGSVIGSSMTGILTNKWGNKFVMILSALLFSASEIWRGMLDLEVVMALLFLLIWKNGSKVENNNYRKNEKF